MWKHLSVRITVDLDEDLLSAVEERRTACKTTGEVVAELARQALRIPLPNDYAGLPSVRGMGTRRKDDDRAGTLA
jgi:Arc/MetJ family transcription regulator